MNFAQCVRRFSTTSVALGKRNFRKFQMPNIRGTIHDKTNPNRIIETFGERYPTLPGSTQIVPELIPEIIVPNLEGFQLKPYVSYNVPDVVQEEFKAEDLFEAIYSEKLEKDFREDKLDANGNPLEPSEEESLTQEEAWARAKRTGADIFG